MIENSKESQSSRPDLPSMFPAAACACALPMALGLINLYFSLPVSNRAWGTLFDPLFGLPVWLCFVFGTPIVAWLTCRALIYRADIDIEQDRFKVYNIWPSALKYSALVHALGFMTAVIVLSLSFGNQTLGIFTLSFVLGGCINVVLFFIVTMPLSLFCTVIFALVFPAPKPKPV